MKTKKAEKYQIYTVPAVSISRARALFKADDALCASRNFEIYRGCVSTANSPVAGAARCVHRPRLI